MDAEGQPCTVLVILVARKGRHGELGGFVQNVPYNRNSRQSVVEYAKRLEGATLRTVLENVDGVASENSRAKGSFGLALERWYFMYQNNSDSRPDFWEIGVELKSTPVIRGKRGEVRPKERISLTQINYMSIVAETFETSSLKKKMSSLLVVFYEYLPGQSSLDFPIHKVVMWDLPESDYALIRADWEIIANKVRQGLAHELSGSDTLYLEAAPKAATSLNRRKQPYSSTLAKPRAFALKPSYVKSILSAPEQDASLNLRDNEIKLGFEQSLITRLTPYVGMTEPELLKMFNLESTTSKSRYAMLSARMLGVAKGMHVAELEKAGIHIKTARIKPNGKLKEAVSFPAFDYFDVASTPWDESRFRSELDTKHLFMLYQLRADEDPVFIGCKFWSMPQADLDGAAKSCYEDTARVIRDNRLEYLPRSTTNECCHVRPHGRDSRDLTPSPASGMVIKRSFWLNQGYLSEQLNLGDAE